MRSSVASVLAGLFAAQAAFAQSEQPPSPNPVEEKEVDASQKDKPKEGTGQPVTTSPLTTATAPKKDAKWDINAPPYTTLKQVPIRTDEGTWMDLDVSPDGRTVAFTVLGDIYTMPIEGGTPRRIAEGLAWEVQPRFSPDGRRIAFTSDRGGGDNIWVMNADGSDKRQVTKEDFRLLNQPSWSPDGEYIVAKKHFTTQRSLGTGEIWIYHVSGGGGVKLVARASEELQKELGEPVYAPDGGAVYYTRNTTPGNTFEYAQDSSQGIFAIERIDLKSGEVTTAVSGYGGGVRPQPSPDGKSISFIRRDKDKSELWVKDLATGIERRLTGGLDLDLQETWAVQGTYPSMAWTPDSKSLVYWAGGKLRRIGAAGGASTVIPFRIEDTRAIADAPHPRVEVSPGSFTTKMVKFATMAPPSGSGGGRIVFESMGKLWVKDSAGAEPRRLTRESAGLDGALELWPAFSRDGSKLAWVRWTDQGLSRIMVGNADGGGARAVTSVQGHYAVPQFSPDGRHLVFEKRAGGDMLSPDYSEDTGIYRIALTGGEQQLVTRGNRAPQYGAANDRIFMLGQEKGKLQLLSTDLNGQDKRVHAVGELASDFRVSPDGKTLAFRQNYEAFAMPLLPGGQAVEVAEKASSLPVTQASKGGASYIGWADNGRTLTWSMGPTLYRADVGTLFANAPQADGAPRFTPPQIGISLARTVAADRPAGTIALTGARILTMAGDNAGAIDNGTVVVTGDRIAAVGANGSVAIPPGAKVIDMAGKTIMPGLVDAHAHGAQGQGDIVPQQNWVMVQQLALGTTTIHDPSSQASTAFAAAERQRAGMMLAPRIFSTAEIVYGAKAAGVYARIDSYDDALQHIRRIKAQGGGSIKNYNQPRRDQRQMVVRAAAAEGMQVVAEGGSLYGMDMTIVADGNSTLEHNVPLEYFYEDALPLPILSALLAVALLSLMDALMKGASLAIGAYSAAFLRSLFGLILIAPLWLARGGRWPSRDVLKVHLLRGVCGSFMALTFFYALTKLPLAETIAISFIAPLVALYLAAIFLGEKIRREAILAAVLGLAGTLVIIGGKVGRDPMGEDAWLGLAAILFSALLYAGNLVISRHQAQLAQPLEISVFHSGVAALVLGVAAPFLLRLPDGEAALLIAGSSLMTVTGMVAFAWAYARAEAQVLVPMEYSGFLWASLFGWLFFSERVTVTTALGTTLIVFGCWLAARKKDTEQVVV